ncbi:hypothetical protein SAMN04244548_01888 [Paracoccus pantotrophus]|nr:hypothetical protein SAMN04244548_01888 [Paracoccus pantotrophus]
MAVRLARRAAGCKSQFSQSFEIRFCNSASWRRISAMSSGAEAFLPLRRVSSVSVSSISGPLLPAPQPAAIAFRNSCCWRWSASKPGIEDIGLGKVDRFSIIFD